MIECANEDCEGVATDAFARVFGDNEGVIHCCPECSSQTEWKQGKPADLEPPSRVSSTPR